MNRWYSNHYGDFLFGEWSDADYTFFDGHLIRSSNVYNLVHGTNDSDVMIGNYPFKYSYCKKFSTLRRHWSIVSKRSVPKQLIKFIDSNQWLLYING